MVAERGVDFFISLISFIERGSRAKFLTFTITLSPFPFFEDVAAFDYYAKRSRLVDKIPEARPRADSNTLERLSARFIYRLDQKKKKKRKEKRREKKSGTKREYNTSD